MYDALDARLKVKTQVRVHSFNLKSTTWLEGPLLGAVENGNPR
jgi:hypothetical protein